MTSDRAGQPAQALRPRRRAAGWCRRTTCSPLTPRTSTSRSPSAPRGTAAGSLKTSFNEQHILATTQAIVDYRREQGSTDRFSSAPTRTPSPGRPGRRRSRSSSPPGSPCSSTARTASSRPRCLARDPAGEPWQGPRREGAGLADGIVVTLRTTRRETEASSTTLRTAGRPTRTRRRSSRPRPTTTSGGVSMGWGAPLRPGDHAGGSLRLPRHLRRRPAVGARHRRDP